MKARLALWLFVAGCSSPRPSLVVDLRTDFVPGIEFVAVESEISGDTVAQPVTTDDGFLDGSRIAEFGNLDAGATFLRVRLRNASNELVAEQRVLVEVRQSRAVTVIITRSCADVSCPSESDPSEQSSCVGGRCVDERCTIEGAASCPAAECEASSDCTASVECADAVCIGGNCYQRDSGRCEQTEWCHPERGCETLPSPADDDAGMADDGSVTDAGPQTWVAAIAAGVPMRVSGTTADSPTNLLAEDAAFATLAGRGDNENRLSLGSRSFDACFVVALDAPRLATRIELRGRSAGSGSVAVFGGPSVLPPHDLGTITLGPALSTESADITPRELEFVLLCKADEDLELDFVRVLAGPPIARVPSSCPSARPRSVVLAPTLQGNPTCGAVDVGEADDIGAGLVRGLESFDVIRVGDIPGGALTACLTVDLGAPIPTSRVEVRVRAAATACGSTCTNCDPEAWEMEMHATEDGIDYFRVAGPDLTDAFANYLVDIPRTTVRAFVLCRSGWSADREHIEVDFAGLACP